MGRAVNSLDGFGEFSCRSAGAWIGWGIGNYKHVAPRGAGKDGRGCSAVIRAQAENENAFERRTQGHRVFEIGRIRFHRENRDRGATAHSKAEASFRSPNASRVSRRR